MAAALDKDELTAALTKIITHMREKGLITEAMSKKLKTDAPTIAKDMEGLGLTQKDLFDPENKNIQKKVMGMLVSNALGTPENYKEFKAGLEREKSELVDPKKDANDAKMDKVLQNSLVRTGVHLDFEKLVNKYKNDTNNKDPKNKDPEEKQKFDAAVVAKVEEELALTIRMLNGGEDIRFPDRIDSVVTYVSGNAKGYPNLTIPDPANVSSYMVERNTPNTGKDASPVVSGLLDAAVSTIGETLENTSSIKPPGSNLGATPKLTL